MNIRALFDSSWHFDLVTAFLTIIVGPLVVLILYIVKRPLFTGTKYIVLGGIYYISAYLNKAAAARLSLRRYARVQLAGSNQYLFVPAAHSVNLEIDKIFVPLILERAGIQTGYDHTNFFEAGNRIVIIGDPGSGKSSIARRVFRDECRKAQDAPRRARFPLLIELRNIPFPTRGTEAKLGDWLFNYLLKEVTKIEAYDIGGCFHAYLRTTGVLVILDGFDEISTRYYARATSAINQFAERLRHVGPNNIVLMTMRIQFYHQVRGSFISTFPVVLSIRRFTPTDIYEFLWRWDFAPTRKIREVTRIYTDLTDRPTLREMCSNPLVLSMYVAQDQIAGHPITPESRTEFYSRVVEELIIRRRAVQVGVVEAPAVIREQRQKILGRIAYEHLCDVDQPANLLDWGRAVEVTSDVTGLSPAEAEKHLRQMSIDTGLITEEREGEALRFIHLTFCEFLCGFEAVQGRPDGWSELMKLHRDFNVSTPLRTRLVEVLPFACALMPRHMRVQGIFDLAGIADERVLALTFLETKQYDHEVWSRFITSVEHRLLNHNPSELHSEWLGQVHLFMVVCADAERASKLLRGVADAERLVGFFTILRKREDGMIYRLIDSYAAQDAAAAFRVSSLCQIDMLNELPHVIIRNCDQPPFLTLLLDLASREPERLPTWSCALAEAGLRSSAVASSLARSSVTLWTTRAEQVERAHRWSGRMLPRTTYTECLTVACSTVQKREPFTLVNALRAIHAPGHELLLMLGCSVLAFIGVLLIEGFVMVFVGRIPVNKFFINTLSKPWLLYAVVCVLVIEVALMYSVIVFPTRIRVYLDLIGTHFRSRRLPLAFFPFPMHIGVGRFIETRHLDSRKTLQRRCLFGRERADRILEFVQARRSVSRESDKSGKVETSTAAT